MYTSSDSFNFQYHIRCFSNYVVSYANRKMIWVEKRKCKILSIAEKLAIFKKSDERSPTNTLCSFAELVGLSESSVWKILQDREILHWKALVNERNRKMEA